MENFMSTLKKIEHHSLPPPLMVNLRSQPRRRRMFVKHNLACRFITSWTGLRKLGASFKQFLKNYRFKFKNISFCTLKIFFKDILVNNNIFF